MKGLSSLYFLQNPNFNMKLPPFERKHPNKYDCQFA